METHLSAFQEAVADQIRKLEAQCNSVFSVLRDENIQLKRQLTEAEARHVSKVLGQDADEGRHAKSIESIVTHEVLPDQCVTGPRERSQPFTPRHGNTLESQPFTPRDGNTMEQAELNIAVTPRSPRQILMVTPGRDKMLTQQPVSQPAQHDPIESRFFEREDIHDIPALVQLGDLIDIFTSGSSKQLQDTISNRWVWFCKCLTTPEQSRRWLKEKQTARKLNLRPVWVVLTAGKSKRRSQAERQGPLSTGLGNYQRHLTASHEISGIRVGSIVKSERSWLQSFTMHPEHTCGMIRALLQGTIIILDVADFPLLAFHKGQSEFADTMLFFSVIFWTIDMFSSFFQGFHSVDGLIEMRPTRIAHYYLRHWFLFDLIVLALDWIALSVYIAEQSGSTETGLANATKVGKFARVVRGGRILRLAKAIDNVKAFVDVVASSEWFVVCARICGLIFVIVLINHYVACAWYAIADNSNQVETWLTVQMIEHSDMFVKYFYSLHWALTQFTPCTNNIAPANGLERFFASFVVLFALVVFSTFLSSLTSAIVQMKKLHEERHIEEKQIRDFLCEKKIPLTVATRIWHHYRKHYKLRQNIAQESDINFFRELPKSLRRELRCHIYIPTLMTFPLFRRLLRKSDGSLAAMLCDVVATLNPASGQDVFLEGEVATQMYFFSHGVGNYSFYGNSQLVEAPEYVVEPVLWLGDWTHTGTLTVEGKLCQLLSLDAVKFQEAVENGADDYTIRALRKYASLFAQQLEDMTRTADRRWDESSFILETATICSDLHFAEEVCEAMAVQAFKVRGVWSLSSNNSSMDKTCSYELSVASTLSTRRSSRSSRSIRFEGSAFARVSTKIGNLMG